jgi:hypothetical protein
MFKQTLEITEAEKVAAGGISYLDMKAFRLTPKPPLTLLHSSDVL